MSIYFLTVLGLFGLAQLSSTAWAEPLSMCAHKNSVCHTGDSKGTVAEPLAALAAQTPWPQAMGRAWGARQGP